MGGTHIITGGDFMPDYKEMYLTMVRASENAINMLIEAQRKCEDLYLSDSESNDPSSPGDNEKDG